MNRKSLLPLLIAVVLGLGAAVFAHYWMKNRIAAVEAGSGGIPVVIAATDIPFGEKIGAQHVKTIIWPAENAPEGALHDTAEAIGKTTNAKLLPGEVVLQSRLSAVTLGGSLAMLIEPNRRAVTVRVNDVIGVAGFLLPGNRVDVLATRMAENHRAQTHTLLENLKVLAVDQTAQAEKDKPVVVRAVTLETDPAQAEALVRATEEGTVQLALRNPNDQSTAKAAMQSADTALGTVADAPAAIRQSQPRTKHSESRDSSSVTVIRQTQVGETKPQF